MKKNKIVIADTINSAISGRLITDDSKIPIPYVTILVEGTDLKTETDSLGNFNVTIPKSYKKKQIILVIVAGYGSDFPIQRISLKNQLPINNLIIEKTNPIINAGNYCRPKEISGSSLKKNIAQESLVI